MRSPPAVVAAILAAVPALAILNPHLFERTLAAPKRSTARRASTSRPQSRQSSGPLFLTNKTEAFAVDGTSLPYVDFDIGESYAGFLPVSNAPNETKELFFWFHPTTNENATDELTLWFTGGPFCSGMIAAVEEHGPFTWFRGTYRPVRNLYAWKQLTNILYIDQPAGTGYSRGPSGTKNVAESTAQFLGFYRNFMAAFDTKGRKTYVTGESFGGYYVPYAGAAMLDADDAADFNVAGSLIINPIFNRPQDADRIPYMPFVDRYRSVLGLEDGVKDSYDKGENVPDYYTRIKDIDVHCGFQAARDEYMTFPPPQRPVPPLNHSTACLPLAVLQDSQYNIKPCWSIYNVLQNCPNPSDPLYGEIVGQVDLAAVPLGQDKATWNGFLNLPATRRALHVLDTDPPWSDCAGTSAEWNSEASLDPISSGALQRLIEATNNTIVASGDLDMSCPTNGTLFALQNLTWNGHQGFRQRPNGRDIILPVVISDLSSQSAADKVGLYGEERGLTFASFFLGTHMLPATAQGGAYRMLERLLGRVGKDLDIPDTQFTALNIPEAE